MRTPDRLPDEALDSLLDGSPSEEAAGTPLAAYLEAVRHDAVTTEPRPSAELSVVLAEGLDPAELEARGTLAATAASTSWRRRGRLVLRALAAKVAALGILGKAAAAGAAVTVVASGAGAAGVLPPPAQTTFNEVVGREAPADPADEGEQGSSTETPPEIPADTSDTEPLDSDVPDDATGSSDGESGVDGGEVADDASDGESDASHEGDVEQRPDDPEDTPAGGRVDDTPADEVPEQAPPTPAPADDASDGDDAAEEGDVEQRPDSTGDAPPTGRPPAGD